MNRFVIALLTLTLAAEADCIIVKKGGRVQVLGLPTTIGDGANAIEITPENAGLYADQSVGVIETEGYDTIMFKKTAAVKAEAFPLSEVVAVFYSSEPDSLIAGEQQMQGGQFLQAIGDLRGVVNDPAAREPFKNQALFQIGVCYLNAGRVADCIKHYQGWKPINSKYTPLAFDVLAQLLTDQRKYAEARAQYDQIPKLAGIPDTWKFKARLGAVRVDTAERKYDDAERTAQAIARETQARADLADANALAQGLQAEAIWRAGRAERLADASAILDRAVVIEGAEPSTRAFLLLTQGNLLYAQGKVEEARFPYLRAALMYPDSGVEGLAYFNAGQCFIDMSGRLEGKDQAKSDKYLVDGMKLLATAAGQYRQADAAKRYRENKARYEAIIGAEAGAPK